MTDFETWLPLLTFIGGGCLGAFVMAMFAGARVLDMRRSMQAKIDVLTLRKAIAEKAAAEAKVRTAKALARVTPRANATVVGMARILRGEAV